MSNYTIFILRGWRDRQQTHFRLENPHTGEIHLFNSLGALTRFLEQIFGEDSSADHKSGDHHAKK
ncbi:MAG: hypothetical protein QNJ45_08955 [Ardenticatenaceae bacterium]|nr:hypothetical protein [Ardenticatenaceae bacterium]